MAQPTPYSRRYNFTNYQTVNPALPLPAAQLDLELNSVKSTIDQALGNLKLIQRDDTALANNSVGYDQLKAELNGFGFNPPVVWTTAHNFVIRDTIFHGSAFYQCLVSHISGVFADDLATGDWLEVANFAELIVDADLGTPSWIDATNATNVPVNEAIGLLPLANLPQGTANLVLMANGASAPSYQQILLSSTSVLGLLPATNGGVYYGSGIAGIQAVDTTKNTTAWLAGRGMFQWMTGNYAARVTADTLNMVYIAANAVASSSGAWVLQDFITRNEINLLWGGITAIADTTPAFNCAVAILALTGQQGGGSIFLPAGAWLGNWVLAQGVGNNIRIRGVGGTSSGSSITTELKPYSNASPCLSVVGNSATNGSLLKNFILEDIFIWQNASTLGYQLFIEQCLNIYMRNVTVLGGTWITGTAQISTYNCFFYGGQSGSPGLLLSNNGGTQQNNGPSVFIGGSIQTQGGTGRGLAIQEDSLAIIFIGVQISSVDGPVTIDGYSTSPSVGSVTFLECHTESSYNATDNTAFAVIGATTAFGTVKFIGGSYFGQGNGTLYLEDFVRVVNAAHVTVDSVIASKLAATNGFSRSGIRLESTFTGKLDVRNFSYSGSGSMYSDARASKAIPSGYSGDVNDNNQWWPGVTSGVGYTQLPGGMQMCWGITAVTSSFAVISFPRAFSSTTGLSVTAVPYGGGSANATSPTSTITTTGFNACSNTAPFVSWMAIGPANP